MEEAAARTDERDDPADLPVAARGKLGLLERLNINLVRRTFTNRTIDRLMTFLQRTIGAGWIHYCTRHLVEIVGLERVPPYDPKQSFILISNHRSFFDMFVISAILYRRGWNNRLLFPVRSSFFYDSPLGVFVNFVMSFFSMYPPIFRDRKKLFLNHYAFNEMIWAMKNGGKSAGIHPEGTRKKDDDPYTFLPAQSGVGRAIYRVRFPVYPVFINGLINDLVKQVASNFTRKGKKIIVVFGSPVDFGTLLDEPPTGRLYKQIAERSLEAIGALAQEEKTLRAQLEGGSSSSDSAPSPASGTESAPR
jgi:1-acyl-sn-glycerol-3-phosphate acyltransferase